MPRLPYLPVTVEQPCAVSPEQAFAIIAPIDLTAIFRGWGPLPSVVAVDNQPPSWDRPGLSRNPRFGDGGTADERLVEFTAPHSFAYEISGFTNAMRFLVDRVRGEWTMTPDGTGSIVRWTYAFFPRPGRGWIVRWLLSPLWRRYATQGLAAAVATVERR